MTRVRKKGAYEDRKTGELIWAEFIHQTARPVDGSNPDPHLHAHCFVFNATWDDKEKQIKAGQFGNINRDMPYYQARFHKILSDKLIDLGYQIRRTKKSFEIDGVPQSAIDLFSKRTNEIGEFAKEKGITDAKKLDELGARTRSKKQKGLSMDELKVSWRNQMVEELHYQDGEQTAPIRYAPKKEQAKLMPADCVEYAVMHSFERASVIRDRRLLETAYRYSIGTRSVGLDKISNSFKADKRIIQVKEKHQTVCTTKEVLREEKQMVDLARKGQGKFSPLSNDVPHFPNLNDQQNNAISHVLTTKNQVTIVRGAAGTGKTTIMTEIADLINKSSHRMIVVAPTAQASRGVLVNEGFKEATTVAKLLVDKELQQSLNNEILYVDEAGLLGTKDMTALLTLADQHNARLILGGDTRQHASVVRGDALRILNTVGGIIPAEVTKIHRQRDVHYKAAVEDLSKGDVKAAFIKLASIGAIHNIDPLNPNEDLVKDYIKTIKSGKTALIVSPTHQQGDKVTHEVRTKLMAAGMIGKKQINAVKFNNTNLTEAQKSDWRNFEKGQIIQFSQNAPKIKRGSIWSVTDNTDKVITLSNDRGEIRILPVDKPHIFDVFNKSEIGLSKGDPIRITKNSFDEKDKRLDNGQSLEVASVHKSGKIKLVNKASKSTYTLDKNFGHIDHAYCTTSHSSQGKTVDEVFISQPSSTFTATDAKQIYVSVSRGRDAAKIYTDDRAALLEYASELGDRQSALELIKNTHLEYVLQKERDSYLKKLEPTQQQGKHIDKHPNIEPDYEPGF